MGVGETLMRPTTVLNTWATIRCALQQMPSRWGILIAGRRKHSMKKFMPLAGQDNE